MTIVQPRLENISTFRCTLEELTDATAPCCPDRGVPTFKSPALVSKERTVSFEKKHSSLLELSSVNMNAFLPESIPSEDLFVEPDIPPKDKEGVSRYLHEKERV